MAHYKMSVGDEPKLLTFDEPAEAVKDDSVSLPISVSVPEIAAIEPIAELPKVSGSSAHLDGSYGLGTSFTTAAILERAIIAHADQFGKEVTSAQLIEVAKELLN